MSIYFKRISHACFFFKDILTGENQRTDQELDELFDWNDYFGSSDSEDNEQEPNEDTQDSEDKPVSTTATTAAGPITALNDNEENEENNNESGGEENADNYDETKPKTFTCAMCKKPFEHRADLSKHQCLEQALKLMRKKKEIRSKTRQGSRRDPSQDAQASLLHFGMEKYKRPS